jgi:hypothetical protein
MVHPILRPADRTLGRYVWAIPWPNGRHLAINTQVVDANVRPTFTIGHLVK